MENNAKIGFCCKFETSDKTLFKSMNQSSTTLTALRSLTSDQVLDRIKDLIQHNIATLFRQLKWLSEQPETLRLFRISSDFLPAYTADEFKWVYTDLDIRSLIEKGLEGVSTYTQENNIRLCTHPGQFTILCTQKPEVLERSLIDLSYHEYLATCMGFGNSWHSQGFAINIHANYNLDPKLKQLKDVIRNRLSPSLRNLLTIENDEFGCSLDELISSKLYDFVPIVLDIHHHWIESGGQYIEPDDDRIKWIKQGWKDIRPLGHFSTSSEELLKNSCNLSRPDFDSLRKQGFKPGKLRAHSYDCWNQASNDWALSHLVWTDLEVEAKGKQVASRRLYERLQELKKI